MLFFKIKSCIFQKTTFNTQCVDYNAESFVKNTWEIDKMYIYFLKEEMMCHTETGHCYISYGVGVYTQQHGKKYGIKYLSDVFLRRKKAEKFVDKCNRLQLHPVHLENVIEDILCQGKI